VLLIFDCDGVLVDSEVVVAPIVAQLFSASGAALTADEVLERFTGLANPEMIRQVGLEFGVEFPDGFLDEMELAELAALERELQPVPGMVALFEGLVDGGVSGAVPSMCVASSSAPDRIRRSLEVTGLARFFGDHLFSATEVARPKPAPDLFLHAASAMGCAARECLVVEDSVFGAAAGAAAGMRVIGFTAATHGHAEADVMLLGAGAEVVARDAQELAALLDTLA
jgi:beta-phosphoglucomutase-like phosphatase (HAD superfamily)